jgi:hypothetical protein
LASAPVGFAHLAYAEYAGITKMIHYLCCVMGVMRHITFIAWTPLVNRYQWASGTVVSAARRGGEKEGKQRVICSVRAQSHPRRMGLCRIFKIMTALKMSNSSRFTDPWICSLLQLTLLVFKKSFLTREAVVVVFY